MLGKEVRVDEPVSLFCYVFVTVFSCSGVTKFQKIIYWKSCCVFGVVYKVANILTQTVPVKVLGTGS